MTVSSKDITSSLQPTTPTTVLLPTETSIPLLPTNEISILLLPNNEIRLNCTEVKATDSEKLQLLPPILLLHPERTKSRCLPQPPPPTDTTEEVDHTGGTPVVDTTVTPEGDTAAEVEVPTEER